MTNAIHPISIGNLVVVRLHKAIVPPALAGVAMSVLEANIKAFVSGGLCGVQSVPTNHRFYQCDDEGYLKIPAGLLSRVVGACELQGLTIRVIDRSRWPVLERAAENLAAIVTDENRNLLNAVVDNPRGQVVANRHDIFERLRQLTGLFRRQRVLIVAINREQRDKLCCQLSASLNRPVSTNRDVQWGKPDRITVVTTDFFSGISVLNVDFDLVVFTHPSCVAGDQAYETASRLNHELIYCFTPSEFHADTLTQLRLEAVCGAAIHDAAASLPVVQVFMVAAPLIPAVGKLSPLERKRAAIWHNDQRNDVVTNLALAIANQDVETFQPRREFLNEHVDLLNQYPNPGIAILVESIEHARELQQRLPEWTLNTAIPDQDGTLDSGTCHRSIVTQAFASHGIHTDVLIRATGTSSPLMVRGFPSVGQRRAIVLFDLADDFDSQAIRDTRERISDYQSRGWIVNAGNDGITIQGAEMECTRQCGRGARS